MARKKPVADCRADTRGGKWAGLPHVVLDSPAYLALGYLARSVLVEIVRRMNGYNNGQIAISQRELAARLNTTNFRAISRAIAELMQHGFLVIATEGDWKPRLAREYRLTFVNTMQGHFSKPATNDYLHWTPKPKSGDDDVSAGKARSADDVSAGPRKSADDVSARIANHRRKTAISENPAADDVSSLICKPYQGDQNTGETTPEITAGVFLTKPPGLDVSPEIRRAYWAEQLGLTGQQPTPEPDGASNG